MLDIKLYIIKIIFSIISTYFLVYFYNKDTKIDFIDIIKYNFICILLLSPAFYISVDNNTLLFYSLLILLLYMYIYQSVDSKLRFLYIFSLIIAILIACNYILYTILGVALYVFINNNLVDIINDGAHSYIDSDKNDNDK